MFYHYFFSFFVIAVALFYHLYSSKKLAGLGLNFDLEVMAPVGLITLIIIFLGGLYFIFKRFSPVKSFFESLVNFQRICLCWGLMILFLFRFDHAIEEEQKRLSFISDIQLEDQVIKHINRSARLTNELSRSKTRRYRAKKQNPYYWIRGRIESIDGFKRDKFRLRVQVIEIMSARKKITSLKEDWFHTIADFSNDSKKPPDLQIFLYSYLKEENLQVGNEIFFQPDFVVHFAHSQSSGYYDFLLDHSIFAAAYFYRSEIVVLKTNRPSLMNRVWNKMKEKIDRFISPPANGLVFSLMTGNKDGLPDSLKENFRRTGTYHVLAVSGMHAMFLFVFFFYFFRMLGFRRKSAKLPIVALFLPLYLFLTHFQISIVRTYVMGLVVFFLDCFDRRINLMAVLVFIFIVMVFYDPLLIYSLSFQLSFSAVMGIGLMLEWIRVFEIKKNFLKYLLISIGAQMGTLFLVIYYFGYVNFFALAYNLFISFVIGVFYIYSLLFFLLPVDFFSLRIGHLLTQLGHLINLFFNFTRLDLEWYEVSSGKGNLALSVVLFLSYFVMMQTMIQVRKRVNLKKLL